jgi:hypothetical protein
MVFAIEMAAIFLQDGNRTPELVACMKEIIQLCPRLTRFALVQHNWYPRMKSTFRLDLPPNITYLEFNQHTDFDILVYPVLVKTAPTLVTLALSGYSAARSSFNTSAYVGWAPNAQNFQTLVHFPKLTTLRLSDMVLPSGWPCPSLVCLAGDYVLGQSNHTPMPILEVLARNITHLYLPHIEAYNNCPLMDVDARQYILNACPLLEHLVLYIEQKINPWNKRTGRLDLGWQAINIQT